MTAESGSSNLKEQDLLQEWVDIEDGDSLQARQQWYGKAWRFLNKSENADHWWCQHTNVTRGLAETLTYHDSQPLVQTIWKGMVGQLALCYDCITSYHATQAEFEEHLAGGAEAELLLVLQRLDAERLISWLGDAKAVAVNAELPQRLVFALYEVLSYERLLDDAEVAAALAAALVHLVDRAGVEVDVVAAGQRYPGVYRLLAHPEQRVRALVLPMVRHMGKLVSDADVGVVKGLLGDWVRTLEFDLFEDAAPATTAAGRPRAVPVREPLWVALKALLAFMEGDAMAAAVEAFPSLPTIIINHCPVGQPPCAVTRHALGCLREMLRGLRGSFWRVSGFRPAHVAELLVDNSFRVGEEAQHKLHVQLAEELLLTLIDAGGAEAEAEAQRMLYFLLHQVPPHQSFSALVKGSAALAAYHALSAALEAGLPTSFAAHLHGPASCGRLQAQQLGAGGPLESRAREAAADLLGLCVQVDAFVLAKLLDPSGTDTAASTYWTAPQPQQSRAATACAVAADAADKTACAPVFWRHLASSCQPAATAALLAAGALVAGIEGPAGAVPAEVTDGLEWSWLASRGWRDETCRHSVHAARHARPLLQLLRGAVGTLLENAISRGDLLGSATSSGGAAAVQYQAGAVRALMRLAMGADSRLAALAERALLMHTKAASLTGALSSIIADVAASDGVLSVAHAALQDVQRQTDDQVLTSAGGALAFLRFVRVLLVAADHDVRLSDGSSWVGDVATWSLLLWAWLQQLLGSCARLTGDAAAAPAVSAVLQLLPVAWYWVFAAEGEGEEGYQPNQVSWLSTLLVMGSSCGPELLGDWISSTASVLTTLPQQRRLPADVVQAATKVLGPGSVLPDAARMQLAGLLPEAAPGNLASAPLAALPSRSSEPVGRHQLTKSERDAVDLSRDEPVDLTKETPPDEIDDELAALLRYADTMSTARPAAARQATAGALGGQPAATPPQKRKGASKNRSITDYLSPTSGPSPPVWGPNAKPSAGTIHPAFQRLTSPTARTPLGEEDADGREDDDEGGDATSMDQVAPEPSWRPKPSNPFARQRPPSVPPPAQQPAAAPAVDPIDADVFNAILDSLKSPSVFPAVQNNRAQAQPGGRKPSSKKRGSGRQQSLAAALRSALTAPKSDPLPRPAGSTSPPSIANLPAGVQEASLWPKNWPGRAPQAPPPPPAPASSAPAWSPKAQELRKQLLAHRTGAAPTSFANARRPCPSTDLTASRRTPPPDSRSPSPLGMVGEGLEADILGPGGAAAPVAPVPGAAGQARQRVRLSDGLPGMGGAGRRTVQLTGPSAPGRSANVVRRFAASKPVLRMEEVHLDLLRWELADVLSEEPSPIVKGLRVPPQFNSIEQYTNTFKRLLLEEMRASVCSTLQEVGGSMRSTPLRLHTLQRQSDLHRLDFHVDGEQPEGCRADSLVLLSKAAVEGGSLTQGAPGLRLLALVTDVTMERGTCRSLHMSVCLGSAGPTWGHKRPEELLLPRTNWHVTPLDSLVPHFRQFQAQRLVAGVLHPLPPPGSRHTLSNTPLSAPLQQALATAFNKSQQDAIAACLDQRQQFTLVQGPPGTGKTSAILGIASALLARHAPGSSGGASRDAGANNGADGGSAGGPSMGAPQAPVNRFKPSTRRKAAAKGANGTAAAGAGGQADGSNDKGGGDDDGPLQLGHLPPARVLVCAQSNAAIDELCSRLAEGGVWTADGSRRVPAMVRMGRAEVMHPSVLAYHMDTMAERKAAKTSSGRAAQTEELRRSCDEVRVQLQQVTKQVQELEQRQARAEADRAADPPQEDAAAAPPGGASSTELRMLKEKQRNLMAQLNKAEATARRGNREAERARKELRQAVVKAAELVLCTLSSAGGDLLGMWPNGTAPLFDALIIDEAAQALEPAALIPLQMLSPAGKVVLVGDPRQLPPTVLSRAAEAAHLSQSMFERLQRAGYPVSMLSRQYRMHPAISAFPSAFFYEGKLEDGVAAADRTAKFHSRACFPPLAVFDCHEGRERGGGAGGGTGGSLVNRAEAQLAAELCRGLLDGHREEVGSIAVLTPYRAQLRALQGECRAVLGTSLQGVEVATVDGFQGREADVIILSCVRAQALRDGEVASIGFLNDVRRMNVAITRARRSLLIVGHLRTLRDSRPWSALLAHAESSRAVFNASQPFRNIPGMSYEQLRAGITHHTAHSAKPKEGERAVAAKVAAISGVAGPGATQRKRPANDSSGAAANKVRRVEGAAATTASGAQPASKAAATSHATADASKAAAASQAMAAGPPQPAARKLPSGGVHRRPSASQATPAPGRPADSQSGAKAAAPAAPTTLTPSTLLAAAAAASGMAGASTNPAGRTAASLQPASSRLQPTRPAATAGQEPAPVPRTAASSQPAGSHPPLTTPATTADAPARASAPPAPPSPAPPKLPSGARRKFGHVVARTAPPANTEAVAGSAVQGEAVTVPPLTAAQQEARAEPTNPPPPPAPSANQQEAPPPPAPHATHPPRAPSADRQALAAKPPPPRAALPAAAPQDQQPAPVRGPLAAGSSEQRHTAGDGAAHDEGASVPAPKRARHEQMSAAAEPGRTEQHSRQDGHSRDLPEPKRPRRQVLPPSSRTDHSVAHKPTDEQGMRGMDRHSNHGQWKQRGRGGGRDDGRHGQFDDGVMHEHRNGGRDGGRADSDDRAVHSQARVHNQGQRHDRRQHAAEAADAGEGTPAARQGQASMHKQRDRPHQPHDATGAQEDRPVGYGPDRRGDHTAWPNGSKRTNDRRSDGAEHRDRGDRSDGWEGWAEDREHAGPNHHDHPRHHANDGWGNGRVGADRGEGSRQREQRPGQDSMADGADHAGWAGEGRRGRASSESRHDPGRHPAVHGMDQPPSHRDHEGWYDGRHRARYHTSGDPAIHRSRQDSSMHSAQHIRHMHSTDDMHTAAPSANGGVSPHHKRKSHEGHDYDRDARHARQQHPSRAAASPSPARTGPH